MLADEEVVHYDIATGVKTDRRYDLVATQRAFYLTAHGCDPERVPFEKIDRADVVSPSPAIRGRLQLRLIGGAVVAFTMRRGTTGLVDYVRQRVEEVNRAAPFEQHVTLGGHAGGFNARYRLVDENGQYGWAITFDEGVDGSSQEVLASVRQEVNALLPSAEAALRSSRQPARYHVSWGPGHGATFVVEGDFGARRFSFWYEPERPPDSSPSAVSDDMMVDQAMGELQVALGEQPDGLVYKWPRPSFMPSFSWTPPLPTEPPTPDPG